MDLEEDTKMPKIKWYWLNKIKRSKNLVSTKNVISAANTLPYAADVKEQILKNTFFSYSSVVVSPVGYPSFCVNF